MLFPPKVDFLAKELHRIKSIPEVSSVTLNNDLFTLILNSGGNIHLRRRPSSDIDVFEQVFLTCEYKPVLGLIMHGLKDDKFIMIDGGANIGLTSLYFAKSISIYRLVCIEPLISNYDMLAYNIKNFGQEIDSYLYNKALAPTQGTRFDIVSDFRDGKDWSASVIPNHLGVVSGVTIDEIIRELEIEHISYLKLDIEGAERFLFDIGVSTSYLDIVKVISIEIHDEFPVRSTICEILINYGFVVFDSGELTIGFKPQYFR